TRIYLSNPFSALMTVPAGILSLPPFNIFTVPVNVYVILASSVISVEIFPLRFSAVGFGVGSSLSLSHDTKNKAATATLKRILFIIYVLLGEIITGITTECYHTMNKLLTLDLKYNFQKIKNESLLFKQAHW